MSITLPNMGLVKWDSLNDKFSHTQLAANIQALDDHDHTTGKGKQIPEGGLAPLSVSASNLQDGVFTPEKLADGSISTAKIQNNAVTTGKLGTGSVTSNELASNAVTTAKVTDANITDAKLASANNGVYRTVAFTRWNVAAGLTSGATKYILSELSDVWTASVGLGNAAGGIFDYLSTDYTVAGGLSTKFRVKMLVGVGATSPSTVTFNGGLYPLTVSGGNLTPGTVVTGSTTGTTPTPALALNTISRYTSSDFDTSVLLSDPGTYALGFVVGSITVPVAIGVQMALQVHHHT
jgi:hypothetical protein